MHLQLTLTTVFVYHNNNEFAVQSFQGGFQIVNKFPLYHEADECGTIGNRPVIRLTAALLFTSIAFGAFAQGPEYLKSAERFENLSKDVIAKTDADGKLPSSQSLLAEGASSLFDVSLLVDARPQSFAPEDFQPLIKLGQVSNKG